MRQISLLLFLITQTVCYGQATGSQFFQIQENGKTGFVNAAGQLVIKPVFRAAGDFSEGLAPARIDGTYGYIDGTGNFVIPPQFDYATPFQEGLAIVYLDGLPFYINKQGQKPFEVHFSVIGPFENGRAIVKTETKKMGAIDKFGKLTLDTIFKSINPFIQGMAVVQGINYQPYSNEEHGIKKRLETGVVDTLGQFVIPYGKYEKISGFEKGYFKIEMPAEPWDTIKGDTKKTGFMDRNGNIALAKDHKKNCWIVGNIYCGLVKMALYKYWVPEATGISYSSDKSYEGFMNLEGKIVVNDTTNRRVKDFSDNRAFVQDKNWCYFMINTQGEKISRDTFSDVIGAGFKNGVAFVKKRGKYGLIDTSANFLIEPRFMGIDDVGMVDGFFFFYDRNQDTNSNYDRLYGVAKNDGSVLLPAMLEDFDRGGFQNGLLKCIVKEKLSYVNKQGKIVWQESDNKSNEISNLNIDYMNRGHFYANSKPDAAMNSGGWAESSNIPKKIATTDTLLKKTLSIVVRPTMTDTMSAVYKGIYVFVFNNTRKKIEFNAQDSRLYMKVQAQNAKGQWNDIEYLPNSWCGNSYHVVAMEPKDHWTFLTPVYEGEFKTKLRIELKYIDPTSHSKKRRERKEITVYSNEYEGSINPGQFWRKQHYSPNGIMDPYDD